jgi:ferredoxin
MKQVLKSSNYEFYVCGPSSMMETITRDLQACGVPRDDIKLEAFGPTPLINSEPGDSAATAGNAKPHRIHFSRSNKTVRWTPSTRSLLELAEASGIKARFGCRAGNCGTCSSGIKDGQVGYIRKPGVEPASGSCLICIARPRGDVVIDL